MYNDATLAFKDNIYSQTRTVKGRVTFSIVDVTAYDDIQSINVTSEYTLSDKSQIANRIRRLENWVTWEHDRVRLDGSFKFTDYVDVGEVGLVSDDLCDVDGYFSVNPTASVIFSEAHSSFGITVTFDENNNDYAEEFQITVYDEVGGIIAQEDYVGNDKSQVVAEGDFDGYYRVDVEIIKWANGNRRSRLSELDFGEVRIYDTENLVSMKLIEDVDYLAKVIPTSEITFVVQNVDREFNLLNPEGIYKFLQENQQVLPEIGIDVGGYTEYVPLGEFFLSEWSSDEGGATATFTATDILGTMEDFTYENLVVNASQTIGDLIEELFIICGINGYNISSSLYNIGTNGLVEENDCRTVLQYCCVAGMSYAYTDREGVVQIQPIVITTADDIIDRDVMFSESQIELDTLYKTIEVDYYTDIDSKVTYSLETGNDTGQTLSYTKNTLINDSTHADDVANWVLGLLDYRAILTTNFRGNPEYELLDTMSLEDLYEQFTDALITKMEINYQGYLKAKMTSRGRVQT